MKSRFFNILPVRSRTVAVLTATLGLFAFPALAEAATLTLDFDEGNGTTSVDQYAGKAGDGWKSAWTTKVAPAASQDSITISSSGVSGASPLYTGGGNYLKFVMDTTALETGSATRSAAAMRRLDSGVISLARPITYSFSFRLENDPSTIASSDYRGPQYFIFVDTSATGTPTTGSTNTWLIQTTSSTNNATSYWQLGNGDGLGGTSFINTTMKAEEGVTYFFTVVSDPATRTWSVTISNGATTYDSVAEGKSLAYRSTKANDAGSWLQFAIKDPTAAGTESFAYSLDNITVSQADLPAVPEPVTATLFLGAGALLAAAAALRHRASR
ncbi:MAG: hypothetical protein LBK99_21915 [Opitutaceae bacterium]|jgi:hypothetical protein|nr:hypothetical protein [Opitutaceae bacterium]